MGDGRHVRDWQGLLNRLDRHTWGRPSPDLASLTELMELYRIPGVSIAVSERDGEMWTAGYGVTGDGGRVGDRTIFQACSISKHVTAFGVLRLVADGVLELDADIHDYLRSWRIPGATGVTLRQVLAHTAGLSDNWFRGYGPGQAIPTLLETLAGQAPANTPPVRPSLLPGSAFRYSGSHYAVVQQLVEDVTGSRFEELMHALVLDPVDMADSSFDQRFPDTRQGLVALGHHHDGEPVAGGWRILPETAGAGMWSTPADLVRFELEVARAVQGRSRLLGQDLATQMVTPQPPADGYGLGTVVVDRAGRRRFGHSGGGIGYGCFSYLWPDAGLAVAVMANSYDVKELLGSINAGFGHHCVERAEPSVAPEEAAGRYLLRDDYAIDITATGDGGLVLAAPHRPPTALEKLPDGGYRLPGTDVEVRFPLGGDHPRTLRLCQENLVQTATRATA